MRPVWAADYVGLPYAEDFNCWSLVQLVLREQFDTSVPDVQIGCATRDLLALRNRVTDVSKPEPGDIVVMRAVHVPHVGVMINETEYLNCAKGRDTCIERIGNRRVEFYRVVPRKLQ
ncbi:MAG: NlpC/P60 family protein [Pseudomonadota bacterium]